MTDGVEEEARAAIARYGSRAHQAVVDRMVAAIRQGDDGALAALAELLRTVERIQHDGRGIDRPDPRE